MNLWKREEEGQRRPWQWSAERKWLLESGSSYLEGNNVNFRLRGNGGGGGGGGYGSCGEVPNDQGVDRGGKSTQQHHQPHLWPWPNDQQQQRPAILCDQPNQLIIAASAALKLSEKAKTAQAKPNLKMGINQSKASSNVPVDVDHFGNAKNVNKNKQKASLGPALPPKSIVNKRNGGQSPPPPQTTASGRMNFVDSRGRGGPSDDRYNENNSNEYATTANRNGDGEKGQRRDSVDTEEEALEYMVQIPETDGQSAFSWRKLWAFTGPGFLMSIAYLDPGNIESDLQSGTIARYRLLWVLLMAHIIGFFLQRLSARLGVVSGRNMAEMAAEYYPKVPRLALWLMIEIAIICSDMQEVIGTAIAFALLSNGRIPLFLGVLITMVDTFTFLLIDRYGFRKLEFIFAILISTMAITFGYEFIIVKPELLDLVEGTFIPYCPGCGRKEFLQAVSVVGAVIMPHNLYLHSALVKSRRIDRSRRQNVSEANLYYFIECAIALTCSFFINLFVVAVFAHGLYGKTNAEIHNSCAGKTIPDTDLFPANDTSLVEADIYKGGIFLGCQFGLISLYIWGIGIMAAGQSSTMTGTYAGQFVMEGFLQIKWPRWRRVLFTRSIAIVPTLLLALKTQGVQNLTGMNDLLNCVQMIQLPFALLPIITFTAHRRIMFDFCSSLAGQVFAMLISCLVISINLYFSFDYILGALDGHWYAWAVLIGPGFIYLSFVLYLMLTCLQSMAILPPTFFDPIPWLSRRDDQLSVSAPWICGNGEGGECGGGQLNSSRDPINEEITTAGNDEEGRGSRPAYANVAFDGPANDEQNSTSPAIIRRNQADGRISPD